MTAIPQQPGSSPKAKKLAARLAAVQALYEYSQNQQPVRTLADKYAAGVEIDDEMVRPDEALLKKILGGVAERYVELELIVKSNTTRKEGQERVTEPLLHSVLMAGAYEILAHQDIDFPIIINDYVTVTHGFYSPGEAGLVNAVLDSIARLLREKPLSQ
jgi:N utilization substance protein B